MPDTTPHREGASSALEAAPGASIALVLVWASQHTRYPLDAETGAALVAVASWASSYALGWMRELRGQISRAASRISIEHDDASSASATAPEVKA
jgi:hypothetical protein